MPACSSRDCPACRRPLRHSFPCRPARLPSILQKMRLFRYETSASGPSGLSKVTEGHRSMQFFHCYSTPKGEMSSMQALALWFSDELAGQWACHSMPVWCSLFLQSLQWAAAPCLPILSTPREFSPLFSLSHPRDTEANVQISPTAILSSASPRLRPEILLRGEHSWRDVREGECEWGSRGEAARWRLREKIFWMGLKVPKVA